MRIEIADKLSVEVSKKDVVCHTYTLNIIKEVRKQRMVIRPLFIERLVPNYRQIYMDILSSGRHTCRLTKDFVPPDGSLILFCRSGTLEISHSMMKIKGNKWIGRNNYGILGIDSYHESKVKSIGSGDRNGAFSYSFIDRRMYEYRKSGGWTQRGTQIASFSAPTIIYDMHYVSIFW